MPENQVEVREAREEDNIKLIDLTAAATMEGDVGLRIDRSPDFFALNRIEGRAWRVGVVEGPEDSIIGCGAFAQKEAYFNGQSQNLHYASDLKVHPQYRNLVVADAVSRYIQEVSCEMGSGETPVLLTILAGNKAMERRSGARGLARFDKIATLRIFSVSFLWKRKMPHANTIKVHRASPSDLKDMAELWKSVAPQRQFAPVLDVEKLENWIKSAPGLEIDSYFVARDLSGKILGFVGFWDQTSFKTTLVTRYSPKLKMFKFIFNLVSPLVGATPLPKPGQAMKFLSALNICVPDNRIDVFKSILIHAYNEFRGKDYCFYSVGLDIKDPLTEALNGLMPQVMDVNAFISAGKGFYDGPKPDGRPLHFEIALV